MSNRREVILSTRCADGWLDKTTKVICFDVNKQTGKKIRTQSSFASYRWSVRHPEPNMLFAPRFGAEGPWVDKVKHVRKHARLTGIDVISTLHPLSLALNPEAEADVDPNQANRMYPQFARQLSAGLGGTEGLNWLTELEYEIWVALNRLRTDPMDFAEMLMEQAKTVQGRTFSFSGANKRGPQLCMAEEGKNVFDDAIFFLTHQTPLVPFEDVKRGMCLASIDHYRDCGPKGFVGDCGSDDSRVDVRLGRYGTWKGKCSEVVCCGLTDATAIVLSIILDDGVVTRCHRTMLFDPKMKFVGIGLGYHNTFSSMCVLTFAESFDDFPMPQQRQTHQATAALLHPLSLPDHCFGCSQAMHFTDGIFANGRLFHPKCFKCSVCGKVMTEYTTDKRYLGDYDGVCCLVCAEGKLAPTCDKCGNKVLRITAYIDEKPHCRACYLQLVQE